MRRLAVTPRPHWRQLAESYGFDFHSPDGSTYWDESAYYAFTLEQIERDIEAPTEALHEMALAVVDEAVRNEELLRRLHIPEPYWDWIAQSWRGDRTHVYGRMDLAYDGRGPAKLYELNYDTPTSLYEAAFFQWLWLEEQIESGALPAQADQFNSLQEKLVERFEEIRARFDQPLYFSAVRGSPEDQGTIAYLRDCAHQAGIASENIVIEDIGLSDDGRYTDLQDRVIPSLFKLYPLEMMFGETFGAALPGSGIQLIEPPWKAILSNKGVLELLWQRHPNHPNLLPARAAQGDAPAAGWVRKPYFSREGANIHLRSPQGDVLTSSGPYAQGPQVDQAFHPLPQFEGRYALIGSWVIGDRAAGMGMREDATLITQNSSAFLPHAIV